MLFVINFKQKRFNKKLSHKFLNLFRLLKLFDTQTYVLIFFLHIKYIRHFISFVEILSTSRKWFDNVKHVLFLYNKWSERIKNKKISKKKFVKTQCFIK